MTEMTRDWDYLIVTASNEAQAAAYGAQLRVRQELGLLARVREVLVVPDPEGKRVGSGGSTVLCLLGVLNRALPTKSSDVSEPSVWREILEGLRILVVHAGGDSMRLPAYGASGKAFIPVPGDSDSAVPLTLLDRQLPTYLSMPSPEGSRGQVVVAAGDDLKVFDPSDVKLAASGLIGLGCRASPEQASRHGVFCVGSDGQVRRFLQKPTPAEQEEAGAVDRFGRSVLDVAVMSFDAGTAIALLRMCGAFPDASGKLIWSGPVAEAITSRGMDLFREVCCAMGTEVTCKQYVAAVRASGSTWDEELLGRAFEALSSIPFRAQVLPRCRFLHFGTTRELITSGLDLLTQDRGVSQLGGCVSINNAIAKGGRLAGANAWVEGCRLRSTLTLGGENVVVGLDVDEPLSLPPEACLDVIRGRSRDGEGVWFVRCYGVDDAFKDGVVHGATFCGQPIARWLEATGARAQDVWDAALPPEEGRLWNARLFPAERDPSAYRRWLWMFDPAAASDKEREAWLCADRYSLAEIAELADHEAFYERRARLRAEAIRRSPRRMFHDDSGFSAADLSYVLAHSEDCASCVRELLAEAQWHHGGNDGTSGAASFVHSRIIHTLGSALGRIASDKRAPLSEVLPGLSESLRGAERAWLETQGLSLDAGITVGEWESRARAAAVEHLAQTIVSTNGRISEPPRSVLRSDEIVWGRAPARLELGGGWTDTPPYSLEHGGCVVNAAIDLNGQPPIQAYARVIEEPVIRIGSIDLSKRTEVADLKELLDYRRPGDPFAVAKAALALSGFSPQIAAWPDGFTLQRALESFGGGLELTTLAAIPKGSGLGTSSIMGAVVLAVLQRVVGRTLSQGELFHYVLRLEQMLTTGGGWQDQVGGVVDGVKVITTEPALVPDARIHYVPPDVLDPKLNGGQTLLYYTGITRVAKNILQRFVGRYLDRDRAAMATLGRVRRLAPLMAQAMALKDVAAFGKHIDLAWGLHKQLNPEATNDMIETLLARVRPRVFGARISGAGGGGFLLMVCKSPADAASVRQMLEADPPNELARFFDFNVSHEGLVVTVC